MDVIVLCYIVRPGEIESYSPNKAHAGYLKAVYVDVSAAAFPCGPMSRRIRVDLGPPLDVRYVADACRGGAASRRDEPAGIVAWRHVHRIARNNDSGRLRDGRKWLSLGTRIGIRPAR